MPAYRFARISGPDLGDELVVHALPDGRYVLLAFIDDDAFEEHLAALAKDADADSRPARTTIEATSQLELLYGLAQIESLRTNPVLLVQGTAEFDEFLSTGAIEQTNGLPRDVRNLVDDAGEHMSHGRHDLALGTLLDALELTRESDHWVRGTVYNVLGHAAEAMRRTESALEYYSSAASEHHESDDPRSLCELGHSFFNVASASVTLGNAAAIDASERAVHWYRAWPATTKVDLVEALCLRVLCLRRFGEPAVAATAAAWQNARALRAETLRPELTDSLLAAVEELDGFDRATKTDARLWHSGR